MKRATILAIIALVLAMSAWYIHRDSLKEIGPSRPTNTPAAGARQAVTPDASFADFFDALDREWNAESERRLLAVTPTAGTGISPSFAITTTNK